MHPLLSTTAISASNVVVDVDTVETDAFVYSTALTADIRKSNMVIRYLKTNPAKGPSNVINLNHIAQSIGKDKALRLIGVRCFTGGD